MAIEIPVFLSAPTTINASQRKVYDFVAGALLDERLQPRTLARSDFAQSDPSTEVCQLAQACHGRIILGFSQIEALRSVVKRGTPAEAHVIEALAIPTPWNHIEAGMLIALRKPVLAFAQSGVTGGIFDRGALPAGSLQVFDPHEMGESDWATMRERIRCWSNDVRLKFSL